MNFNSLFRLLKNLNLEICIVISAVLAALVFFLIPSTADIQTRLLATWSSGVLCFLMLVLFIISDASPEKTRNRTQRRDANPRLVLTLVLFTTLASVFAIGFMLNSTKEQTSHVVLSIVAILCSWSLTHTAFAINYAHYYYDNDGLGFNPDLGYVGGLEFPGNQPPDYFDFMYFAFTISTTSQTSDVSITARPLRRIVLAHEMISFLFYSIIIGFVVNTVDALI